MNENTTTLNGQSRKTLATQLDRLDQVLDGLADNLNEAVADAVRKATGQAVQEAVHKALVEVLTSPELIALLGGVSGRQVPTQGLPEATPVSVAERPTLGQRLGQAGEWASSKVGAARDWATSKVGAARAACGHGVTTGLRALGSLRSPLLALWRLRMPLLIALGVGAVTGVAAFVAGPWVASLLTGLAGSAATLAIQARFWLLQALSNFTVAAET